MEMTTVRQHPMGRMSKQGKTVRINDIRAILNSEYTVLFNPLPTTSKAETLGREVTDHIGFACRYGARKVVYSPYSKVTSKKWLVTSIAPFDRETVNHEIFVLIGPQGGYRLSTSCCRLRCNVIFTSSPTITAYKDDMFSLAEFVFICTEK